MAEPKRPRDKTGHLGYWPPIQPHSEPYARPDDFGADDYSEESSS